MHFGRVQSDKGLDLTLPPVGARTSGYLKLGHKGRGLIYCGAPVWSSLDWQGLIYPARARPSEYLRYYAQHYSMIEFNGSFYRIPTPEQVRTWRRDVGPEFRFCPKVAKDLSHQLARFDKDLLHAFIRMLEAMGDHLGLSFMQLPEWYGVDQFPHLEAFAAQWPKDFPLAIEFRHPSWFQNAMLLDPVINFLYRNTFATVITDTPGQRGVVHMSLTYPKVLIRFMGVFPSKFDQQRLKAWMDRLEDWARGGMDAIYFAVHQERNAAIPQTVDFIHRYLIEKTFEGLVRPKVIEPSDQDFEASEFTLGL
jgi:uncharacterized protein YecE (DUF72 family)